jgi:hypothetical protein
MSLILLQAGESSVREPALPPEPRDQSEFFERAQMGQGRWRLDPQSGGDVLEARPTGFLLVSSDDSKGLHLTMGELLKGLHGRPNASRVYISATNY